MRIFVLITSYKEETTVGKAVEQIICPNKDLWPSLQLVVAAPDRPTLAAAEEVCKTYGFENYRLVKDGGEGKASAINLAVETITKASVISPTEDLLILTDGDMYVADDAVKNLLKPFSSGGGERLGGVGGHPVSLDDRGNMFGYYSHLFCEAAHRRRLTRPNTPMSGYLYAVRFVSGIFPIPPQIRAEDAYVTQRIAATSYKIAYVPNALACVKFPKNLGDWFRQKTRSLGGNVQIGKKGGKSSRSVAQDLQMALFPIFFARNLRELTWSLMLYPLRLILWLKIYYNHAFDCYKPGAWERIESSK